MDIAQSKIALENKKVSLQNEIAVIQIALDVLDDRTIITFPNLDEVISEKEQAKADKSRLEEIITEKDAEIVRLTEELVE